jgi:hypothetical protein
MATSRAATAGTGLALLAVHPLDRLAAVRGPQAVASGLLSGPAHYLHWGVIQISLTNFLIIVVMVVLFVLALVLPFPGPPSDGYDEEERSDVRR